MSDSGRLSGSREPSPSGLGGSRFDPERLAENLTDLMISELRNVAEGKPIVPGFGNPVWHLKCLGYVEERTVYKPCRTCGTPQVDYRFNKITQIGRSVLDAAIAMEARSGETEGLDPKDDSAGRNGIAQGIDP